MRNSDPILCRLELTVDKALHDCSKRLKRLDGRDKKALQEEWLEFNSIQDCRMPSDDWCSAVASIHQIVVSKGNILAFLIF